MGQVRRRAPERRPSAARPFDARSKAVVWLWAMHIPRLNIPRSSASVSAAFATASASATATMLPAP